MSGCGVNRANGSKRMRRWGGVFEPSTKRAARPTAIRVFTPNCTFDEPDGLENAWSTPLSGHNPRRAPAPNVLAQDFSATRPNQKWLVDITYLATREGWLYLAGVLDTYSRRIVGWSMSERLTEPLVCDALKMALVQRGAPDLHHSDQGSQYTARAYLALLEKAHIQVSMSGVGRCYDNAMQESFWATLKRECADHTFPTRAFARQAIFEYIEVWYNRQRRHSALGYLSPCAFERLALL